MTERLKNKGVPQSQRKIDNKNPEHSDDDGADMGAPRDLEFEVGMIRARDDSPRLQLPEDKDTLYVTKPIGDYEPIKH